MIDDLVDCLERTESLAQPIQISQLEQAKPAVSKHVRHAYHQLAMSRRGPATGLVGVRRCAVQIRHLRWSGLDTISRTPLRKPWGAECVAARGRDACHQAVTSKPRCTDNSLRTRPRRKRASCRPSQQRQHALLRVSPPQAWCTLWVLRSRVQATRTQGNP